VFSNGNDGLVGESFDKRYNVGPELRQFVDRNPIAPGQQTISGHAALKRRTVARAAAYIFYRLRACQRLVPRPEIFPAIAIELFKKA
jgi:hypothetical protein